MCAGPAGGNLSTEPPAIMKAISEADIPSQGIQAEQHKAAAASVKLATGTRCGSSCREPSHLPTEDKMRWKELLLPWRCLRLLQLQACNWQSASEAAPNRPGGVGGGGGLPAGQPQAMQLAALRSCPGRFRRSRVLGEWRQRLQLPLKSRRQIRSLHKTALQDDAGSSWRPLCASCETSV